jgi:hypothetical protein
LQKDDAKVSFFDYSNTVAKIPLQEIYEFSPNSKHWEFQLQRIFDQNELDTAMSFYADSLPQLEEQDSVKNKFVRELYAFMENIGQPIVKTPFLGYQELDLYKLYQIVTGKGGMDEVTKRQEWKSVYQELGIPTMSTSASYNTRTNYKKYLYLYELENFRPTVEKLGENAASLPFKYEVGTYIKIEPSLGSTYYAQIVKKRHQKINMYYIHYNGWSTSHDEWMPENVLLPLDENEELNPKILTNPPPSRSSKSNYLLEDGSLHEKPAPIKKKTKEALSEYLSDQEKHQKRKKKQKFARNSETEDSCYSSDSSDSIKAIKEKFTTSAQQHQQAKAAKEKQQERQEEAKRAAMIHKNNAHTKALNAAPSLGNYRYLDVVFPEETVELKKTLQKSMQLKKRLEEINSTQASLQRNIQFRKEEQQDKEYSSNSFEE